MVRFSRSTDKEQLLLVTQDGDLTTEWTISKHSIKVLYGGATLSVYNGNKLLVDAEGYAAVGTNDIESFHSMEELKAWVSEELLVGDGSHQEVVSAPVRDVYAPFDYAPCRRLLLHNRSGYDLTWHMGNEDRAMRLNNGEQMELTGITNANQVYVKAVAADVDGQLSGLVTF